MGASDVGLAAADDDRGLAGKLLDHGADGDWVLVVVDAGEFATSADHDHSLAAIVEQSAGAAPHGLRIDGAFFVQCGQHGGDNAAYAFLEGGHRVPFCLFALSLVDPRTQSLPD